MQLDDTMRALLAADLVRPKEIFVKLAGAGDALADQLGTAARELGIPPFAISDGELWSFVSVRGNPWDTHDALTALRALSQRFSDLGFELGLDPEGTGTLRAGELTGIAFGPLARWVAAHPRPRHSRGDVRAALGIRATRTTIAKLREELADYASSDGLVIDRTDRIAYVLGNVVRRLVFEPEGWHCELVLRGGIDWRYTVSDFRAAYELECLVGTLFAEVQPMPEPERAPGELPRAPEIARVLGTDQLLVTALSGKYAALLPDGRFVPVPAPPRYWSDDRSLAVRAEMRALLEWVDVETGEIRDVGAGRRSAMGFAGSDLVLRESIFELGRIRTKLVVHARDGSERTTREFINTAGDSIVDPRTIVLSAERDGVPELISIDLATLTETVVCSLRDQPEPRVLYRHGDALIGLTRSKDLEIARYPSRELVATLPGSIERVWRDGDVIWIVATRRSDDAYRSFLHRITLADGSHQTIDLAPLRSNRAKVAGAWLLWQGFDDRVLRRFENGEPRGEVALPSAEIWDFAISSTGAVAWVSAEHVLEVIRGDARARVELPADYAIELSGALRS